MNNNNGASSNHQNQWDQSHNPWDQQPQGNSYQDQRNFAHDDNSAYNNNFNNPDLYEHETNSHSGVAGRVRQVINNGPDHHSTGANNDLLDMFCGQVDQELVVPKTFYFFFFAAFGSLFPLMAIYFKQMAMSPIQVGCLFGFKPFIEFVAAPFWANVGERFRQTKFILLFSLICWIGFTLGLGFIHPPVHSCLMHNETHLFISKTADNKLQLRSDRIKRGLSRIGSGSEIDTSISSGRPAFERSIVKRDVSGLLFHLIFYVWIL